jgi:hypothetical protein
MKTYKKRLRYGRIEIAHKVVKHSFGALGVTLIEYTTAVQYVIHHLEKV